MRYRFPKQFAGLSSIPWFFIFAEEVDFRRACLSVGPWPIAKLLSPTLFRMFAFAGPVSWFRETFILWGLLYAYFWAARLAVAERYRALAGLAVYTGFASWRSRRIFPTIQSWTPVYVFRQSCLLVTFAVLWFAFAETRCFLTYFSYPS